jgi:hypothetical protein
LWGKEWQRRRQKSNGSVQEQESCIEIPIESSYRKFACPDLVMKCCDDVMLSLSLVLYMTVHQQDSSQPQQSHDSPQERTGAGLTMEEMEEAMLAGMLKLWWNDGSCLLMGSAEYRQIGPGIDRNETYSM